MQSYYKNSKINDDCLSITQLRGILTGSVRLRAFGVALSSAISDSRILFKTYVSSVVQ